jgi:hypothetical protein
VVELPSVAAALALLRSRFAKALWARLAALGLLAAPFLWTLFSLFLSSDADDRAENLLALWPLLLILSAALTLWNFCRHPSLRAGLSVLAAGRHQRNLSLAAVVGIDLRHLALACAAHRRDDRLPGFH